MKPSNEFWNTTLTSVFRITLCLCADSKKHQKNDKNRLPYRPMFVVCLLFVVVVIECLLNCNANACVVCAIKIAYLLNVDERLSERICKCLLVAERHMCWISTLLVESPGAQFDGN